MRSPPLQSKSMIGKSGHNHVLYNLKTNQMKTTILKISVFFLLFGLMGAGCVKDEDSSNTILDGEWTLIGSGDDSTGEYESEPTSEPQSSYVVFDNGSLNAFSVTNKTYDVTYIINENRIRITDKGGRTKVGGDTEWGLAFLLSISDIIKFSLIEDSLTAYYTETKYLKFKKETK